MTVATQDCSRVLDVHELQWNNYMIRLTETVHPFIVGYCRWHPKYLINQLIQDYIFPYEPNEGLQGFMVHNPEISRLEINTITDGQEFGWLLINRDEEKLMRSRDLLLMCAASLAEWRSTNDLSGRT